MSGRRATGYVAESTDGLIQMDLPPLIECKDTPNDREEIPIPEIAEHILHLADIASQIPHLNYDAPIALLISRDMVDAHRAAFSVKEAFGYDVCDFVLNNFYVDDGLLSLPDVESAVDILKRTHIEGILRLHKISSNSQELMDSFPSEDIAENLKNISCQTENPPLQRSLGIFWDISRETFTCTVSLDKKPFTKRGVLSTVGSLYDPLCLLAPITIKGKMFFRNVINMKSGWNAPLPSDLEREWHQWWCSPKELEILNIPRCYGSGTTGKNINELHVFSDSSSEAIAAVAFLRTINCEGQTEVSFVLGKAKLASAGGHTIPRLELCAAVLATQIKDTVIVSLHLDINKV
ncbi:uncharacterized protein LOC110442309 [Mizuhopecten yessoensis]|uniref:uncharacterized protein LOC110442309 n=1 Tax=Mizuhopecten yessoensis TaxID=6573 RepID=UPI000B457699|nr:uncharacterized protein LOC110442309 [Mizuhopecten yessoensis]